MEKKSQDFSMDDVMRIANSPAGQQLISYLQQHGGQDLKNAISKANAGDLTGAKQQLSSILSTKEAQNLLKQLEALHE